jgi:hypothetical protein
LSSIVPKKAILFTGENKAESRKTTITNKEVKKKGVFGRTILPSEKRAAVQKIKDKESPKTKSKPLDVSIGILIKGKKKTGNKTTTKKRHQKEILSKVFDNIFLKIKINYN